ncbi:MAG: NAD(P)-dependent oxidoreductase [Pseudomonadota bacterium]
MSQKAIVLAPPSPSVLRTTDRYNAMARELGGQVEFHLVDSDAGFEDIVRACEGAIAVTTPAYRKLRRDIVNDIARRVPTLKLLQASSAGTDTFDKPGLAALGVAVANHGGSNAVAVAEHAIALMVAVWRKLDQQIAAVRAGEWSAPITSQPVAEFRTLVGKRVGIVGLGRIGSRIAKRLRGWECEVVFTDPEPFDDAYVRACDATRVDLDTLLATSDVVSLSVPLEPSTRHMLSDREFGLMKAGAIVINTSRGPVIDEPALVRALLSGKVFGAGLDVVEKEPIAMDNPLLGLRNVIVTPHQGTRSLETEENIVKFVVGNIARLARGEAPQSVVRPVPANASNGLHSG